MNPMGNNPMMNQMNINPMGNNLMMNQMNINPMMNPIGNNPMMNPMDNNPMMNQMNNNLMMQMMMEQMMMQMKMNPIMNSMNMNQMMDQMAMNNPPMPFNLMMNDIEKNNQKQMNQMLMQMKGQSIMNDTQKKVEEFIINLHSNIQPRKTYIFKSLLSNFEEYQINVHKCSMNLYENIIMVDHPVLTGYYLAFLDHYPVVLSPDILWMLILQGFSHHVKLNYEKLRNKFVKVNTDDIVVTQNANGDNNINNVSTNRWGDIFKDFVEKSKEYIDGAVLHLLTPYFSTTTSDIENASQIAITSIVSPYIKYIKKFKCKPCIGGCGFPYIKLQGTLQDYKQLKMKVEGLKGYLIDDWINKMLVDINKIIETKQGKIDKQFWDNMITNQKREYFEKVLAPSSESHYVTEKKEKIQIFGWIFDFFPHKIISKEGQDFKKIIGAHLYRFNSCNLKLNDIKIYHNSDFEELPDEILDIGAIYRKRDGKTAELGIKTGFLGYSLNINREIQPEIGWYFYIKSDPHNLITKLNN